MYNYVQYPKILIWTNKVLKQFLRCNIIKISKVIVYLPTTKNKKPNFIRKFNITIYYKLPSRYQIK